MFLLAWIHVATATPDLPVLLAPTEGATGVPICASLSAAVDDPEGDLLDVRFMGRRVHTDFSVIVLPDTQWTCSETQGGLREMFYDQTSWIASMRDDLDIAYVAHVGDLINDGDDDIDQWYIADEAMSRLEDPASTGLPEGIPYGIAPGNHEQTPHEDPNGTTAYLNSFFGLSRFQGRSYFGGHYGGDIDNNYMLFNGGGIDFVVIDLEYDQNANPSVLSWAAGVLAAYPDRLGIVVCHPLLYGSGSFDPQGQAIYDALSGYPNLFLMLSGHRGGEVSRTDVGAGTVHTMMADYQFDGRGGSGYLRILSISPFADEISVSTYSPWLDDWETDADSEFTLAYDFPEGPDFQLIGQVSVPAGSDVGMVWDGLEPNSTYQWYVEASDGSPIVSDVGTFTTGTSLPVDGDGDGWTACDGDCDDSDFRTWPGAVELCDDADNDCDGTWDEGFDQDLDGWRTCEGDCADLDPLRNPGSTEILDSIDNDCDWRVDEGTPRFDDDGDGHSEDQGDCDDNAPRTFPDAVELEDGADNDCDGVIDEDTCAFDDDGDGLSERDGDCDDTDAGTWPLAPERADGRDQDCDGLVDEGTSRADDDGDGWTEARGDCDDGAPLTFPHATELEDGADNDCDGVVDEDTRAFDDDGDGFAEREGDCDDGHEDTWPLAPEFADGRDQDCDGLVDEGTEVWDDDGDAWTEDEGDCNDMDPAVFPGAPEEADGVDDDCDGLADEGTDDFDDDGDGFTERQGDCDDARADTRPGATELADAFDNDCDGLIDDETEAWDDDHDGWTESQGDCDDLDRDAYPGAIEPEGSNTDRDCDGQYPRPQGWGAGCNGGMGRPGFGALVLALLVVQARKRS